MVRSWNAMKNQPLVTTIVRLVVVAAMSLCLLSCGGGDTGGETPQAPQNQGAGWVTIENPTASSSFTTNDESILMSGAAFISPTWWSCCSGDAVQLTGVTVTVTNAATGVSERARQTVQFCPFFILCGHTWSQLVDIVIGTNVVTVTASDHAGNLGTAILTVTRPPDFTPPTVSSTNPAANALGVALDAPITAIFSERMTSATINTSTFLLSDANNTLVAGTVTYADRTATFTPSSDLVSNMAYTATITTGVKDESGNALKNPYSWTFTANSDFWQPTSTIDVPTSRAGHTAVWTGNEMIVWGGVFLNSGGRYDPRTDSWTSTSVVQAPSPRSGHVAVWTGTEMIVWGGQDGISFLTDGGRYNPLTDTWQPIASTNMPSARSQPTVVWTGTVMIVWGGIDATTSNYLNTGAKYDPVADTWSPISVANAPLGRTRHTAVWTGQEMVVWGGVDVTVQFVNTGGRYNPTTDTWQSTPSTGAPSGRADHVAVWSGTEMIVWGGIDYFGDLVNTGGRYNPATGSWQATTTTNAPVPGLRTAVWSGKEMLVWSGNDSSGGKYNPSLNRWNATSLINAPSQRQGYTAVWAQTSMIIWGGYTDAGGRYTP
jgi:Big-like domain-containing protein/Kelch motif protein